MGEKDNVNDIKEDRDVTLNDKINGVIEHNDPEINNLDEQECINKDAVNKVGKNVNKASVIEDNVNLTDTNNHEFDNSAVGHGMINPAFEADEDEKNDDTIHKTVDNSLCLSSTNSSEPLYKDTTRDVLKTLSVDSLEIKDKAEDVINHADITDVDGLNEDKKINDNHQSDNIEESEIESKIDDSAGECKSTFSALISLYDEIESTISVSIDNSDNPKGPFISPTGESDDTSWEWETAKERSDQMIGYKTERSDSGLLMNGNDEIDASVNFEATSNLDLKNDRYQIESVNAMKIDRCRETGNDIVTTRASNQKTKLKNSCHDNNGLTGMKNQHFGINGKVPHIGEQKKSLDMNMQYMAEKCGASENIRNLKSYRIADSLESPKVRRRSYVRHRSSTWS
ncbi:unnamed protein product, partial [Owenia fusiformis]